VAEAIDFAFDGLIR